jgi:hypothetical protein
MAASFKCDGCGESVEVPVVVGHVLKRDYCRSCEIVAKVFIETEEGYRLEAVAQFAAKRQALIEQYANFKLPDVP